MTFFRDPRCVNVDQIPLGMKIDYATDEDFLGTDIYPNNGLIIRPTRRSCTLNLAVFNKLTGNVEEVEFYGTIRPKENQFGTMTHRSPTPRERTIIDAIARAR